MTERFRAKYNSTGFRGLSWRSGTEIDMTHEEFVNDPCAKHFEPVSESAKTWPVEKPEPTFQEQLKKVEVAWHKAEPPKPIETNRRPLHEQKPTRKARKAKAK